MTCCPILNEVLEKFPLPLHYPITIDPKTLDFETGRLGIELYTKTPAGRISKKGHTVVYLNYCPWCGEKLQEEGEGSEL